MDRGAERTLNPDLIRRSERENLQNPDFMVKNLVSFANLGAAKEEAERVEERRRADARRREGGRKMKNGLMIL